MWSIYYKNDVHVHVWQKDTNIERSQETLFDKRGAIASSQALRWDESDKKEVKKSGEWEPGVYCFTVQGNLG